MAIQGVVTKCPVSDSMFSQCSVADLPNVVSRSVAKNAPSRNVSSRVMDKRPRFRVNCQLHVSPRTV
ncbi:hypothetical protein HF086_016070 [Spodoptera exigua]|uniref:Uncharacterized protein n=1 Tax=Spodoptera exigua TaxID=7107 RepID=A0A922M534_SPOEX|nr:hypothetical protein HF086_016070 [Spodoptera exigua]